MKIQTRLTAFVVGILIAIAGCSEEVQNSSTAATMSDAELTSRIIEIYAEPDRLDRTESLMAVLRAVGEGQGDALGAALDGLEFQHREPEQVLIVAAWSKVDPEGATRWVLRNGRMEYVRFLMMNEAIYEWARTDPEGLVRDLEIAVYTQKGWDKASIRALVRGWYDSGKPNLEQWVYDLPPTRGDDRQRAASALIESKLANEGIERVIEWATETMDGFSPYRQYIYSRLAGDIAKIDPDRAIAWCEEICDTKLGSEVPLWIATTWVVDGGAAAMDWITVRDSKVLSNRIGARAAYRRFLLKDQVGALAWMESLSEEERTSRDSLQGPLYMFVNERSGLGDHEVAIEWSKYLTSDREREEILETIARRWLREDPPAAEAWLTEAPLSDDAKIAARSPRPSPRERKQGFRAKETILSD